jgi:long-chain fatty acid transport protein
MIISSLRRWKSSIVIIALVTAFSGGTAWSAGFGLIEQGVRGLGGAYAGEAASTHDASTIFYNPAGLVRLERPELIIGSHLIFCYANFKNEGSRHVTGAPLTGGDDGNAADTGFIPNFYYSRKISDRMSAGIGINAPFGLSTEYSRDWVGRYHAVKSDLMSVNINPAIAYRITDKLSAGAGFSVQYLKAELSNAIDFGTVLAGVPGFSPQSNDGFVELEGDSWGVGYNLGLLYEFSPATRAGLAYRSRIEHTLEGDADFSAVPVPLRSTFSDTDIEGDITLPDSLSLSLYHQFHPQWAVMADVSWTNWQLFEELVIDFDNTLSDNRTQENWQDSYRYSVGVNYMPNDQWVLRAGTAYDKTAIPNAKYRTPRVPCSDRIWAAFGAGYRVSDRFAVDFGYAHLFINDPEINKTATGDDMLRGALKGKYEAHIDIVSGQLTMYF